MADVTGGLDKDYPNTEDEPMNTSFACRMVWLLVPLWLVLTLSSMPCQAQQPSPKARSQDEVRQLRAEVEMLRVLENGYKISVGITQDSLIEIDTPQQAKEFESVVKLHYKP